VAGVSGVATVFPPVTVSGVATVLEKSAAASGRVTEEGGMMTVGMVCEGDESGVVTNRAVEEDCVINNADEAVSVPPPSETVTVLDPEPETPSEAKIW